jgi:hypothetical protein
MRSLLPVQYAKPAELAAGVKRTCPPKFSLILFLKSYPPVSPQYIEFLFFMVYYLSFALSFLATRYRVAGF